MTTLDINSEIGNEWLPDYCPKWCTGGHAEVLAEGCAWEIAQLHRRSGGGEYLHEVRNPIDGRVMRSGGGGYELYAEQQPRYDRGFETVATINLAVRSEDDGKTLPLTTGEARTLARQILALADELDLP